MPELPEVETIVKDLIENNISSRTIHHVHVFHKTSVACLDKNSSTPEDFVELLEGKKIVSISRRGKWMILELKPSSFLLIHLRMSGRIDLIPRSFPKKPHEHVIIELDGSLDLRLHDTRKFARIYVAQDKEKIINKLGFEPLDNCWDSLKMRKLLKQKKRKIKPLLLDQSFIAGIGNIYADEILWQAKVHPERMSHSLTESEVITLCDAIRLVIRKGIELRGTSLGHGKGNFHSIGHRMGENQHALNVFRKTNLPCPRCQNPILRIKVAQRSTHFCPICQI